MTARHTPATTYYVTLWRKSAGCYPEYRTQALTPHHAMLRERDGFDTVRMRSVPGATWAFGAFVTVEETIHASHAATARRKAMILSDREDRKIARSARAKGGA